MISFGISCNDIQQLQQLFPELIAITDGTEQQIPRPKDRTKREKPITLAKRRDIL